MTDRNLFFNGIWWRQHLKNEQAVRFLEELWRRAGGGPVPDQNLNQVVNEITQIDQSTTEQGASLHQARRIAEQMAAEIESDSVTAANIKRLSGALEHLSDELNTERAAILSELKKLKHRISQLEDTQ
ncbi:hypothetical protein [Microbulbifer celer]|uniref:Uncharacterized protein n=1 Tax=Microbulbifer celer TaxID=435905 RepID=A0ABW3UAB2_9GAMM|nr:hypothetical protein [Microbulbifer celer]UFN58585.1 hypothetical protein LPW13_05950 [Microbulbifer celer]